MKSHILLVFIFLGHFIHDGVMAQNKCKIDNLIVNGDFEDTAKHCFVFNPVNKLSDMSYPWRGYSMFIWQPLTKLQPFYLDEVNFDHSTNTKNGHYLYIDPRNASAYVWQFSQTVKVEKGKQYTCSLWYSSMNKTGNPEANIRLTVNGVPISPLKKVNNISNFWDSIQGTWNSGTATAAQISLELLNPKVGGNDFAIDDVYFGQGVLIADAGKDSVMCSESEFKLGVNEPASLGASCNAYRYKWTPVNAIDGPSDIAHPKLKKPIQMGDYVLKVLDMNGNECLDTVNISLRKYFQLNFNDSLICDSIKISIPDSIGNVLWNDGSTSHERFLKKAGIYTIQYTGICSIEYDTFVIRRTDEIKSVVKIDNYFCTDDRFKVEITMNKEPIQWFDGDTALTKIFKFPGSYTFKTITNCGVKYDTVVLKDSVIKAEFKVPNVFTPNNDGINDCFELEGIGPSLCIYKEVSIYDRWGISVYEGRFPNTCWNGRLYNKGEELSDGLYFYLIYDQNDNSSEPISGTIQLIR